MKRLVFESWLLLFRFDWIMRFRDFSELCRVVHDEPLHPRNRARQSSKENLCRAMDFACVFYHKPVLCLQRSAATTLLLRHHGWSAEMVIGAQMLPFKSHAWCEVEGAVVNDKSYMPDIYKVLDRC